MGSTPEIRIECFSITITLSIVFGDVANHEVQLGLSLGNAGKHAIS